MIPLPVIDGSIVTTTALPPTAAVQRSTALANLLDDGGTTSVCLFNRYVETRCGTVCISVPLGSSAYRLGGDTHVIELSRVMADEIGSQCRVARVSRAYRTPTLRHFHYN